MPILFQKGLYFSGLADLAWIHLFPLEKNKTLFAHAPSLPGEKGRLHNLHFFIQNYQF